MKQKKSKPPISTIVMYAGAIIVALISIAFLVNNVQLFNSLVTQYVSQGYSAAEVNKQLLPNQLLPGIYQTIVYIGVALILWGAGVINKKVGLCLKMLGQNNVNAVDVGTTEQTEIVESPEK